MPPPKQQKTMTMTWNAFQNASWSPDHVALNSEGLEMPSSARQGDICWEIYIGLCLSGDLNRAISVASSAGREWLSDPVLVAEGPAPDDLSRSCCDDSLTGSRASRRWPSRLPSGIGTL